MLTIPFNFYQLIEGMLFEGLPYIASYLEKLCKHQVMVCDRMGKIHYPDLQENNILPDLYIKIPAGIEENAYFYQRSEQRLYYRIGTINSSAYIIVSKVRDEQVSFILSSINSDITMAVKYYFANIESLRKDKEKIKRDLSELLFVPGKSSIKNLLKAHSEEINIFRPYFFSIMEADSHEHELDWQGVRSYSEQYLKENGVMTIQIPSSNNIMGLVPANGKQDEHEVDSEWFTQNAINHKKAVESRFKFTTSVGEGNIYPLSDIYKSYFEATISISLPKLMGQRHYIKRFSELGIFSLIYSNDASALNAFCTNTLGRVLDYDQAHEGVLLPTLRSLLDNCFNWKNTARQMYVHVNTLHYRVNKIEQLMQVDLSHMENRVNTFLAIKVYDLQQFNKSFN